MSLSLKAEKRGAVCILHVKGRLDASTSPELDNRLKALMADGCKKIVCDLKELNYISSAGVGVFSNATNEMLKRGGEIILAGLPQNIYKIIEMLGFSKIFKFANSVEEAIK